MRRVSFIFRAEVWQASTRFAERARSLGLGQRLRDPGLRDGDEMDCADFPVVWRAAELQQD